MRAKPPTIRTGRGKGVRLAASKNHSAAARVTKDHRRLKAPRA